ncbi:Bifunctional polymyxin resistance protein ArnA [Geranomyces variabilis]|nr:Bifunctional polymyxin resistance protein ArnA [Geranomyces variabilis]
MTKRTRSDELNSSKATAASPTATTASASADADHHHSTFKAAATALAAAASMVPAQMKNYHPFPQKAPGAVESTHTTDSTPQTASSAYRLAWADNDFLLRDDMRPLRLQLEYAKPEKALADAGVESTVVVFGSARIHEKEKADANLALAEKEYSTKRDDESKEKLRVAKKMVDSVKYYEAARELGELITKHSDGNRLVIITGGGGGIMGGASRGASQVPGGRSVGLNIVLPFEQKPNPYVTPELCFNFHYFSMRKMHFLGRARALVAFPGGWGTMDELFEALTLIQTKKMAPVPVILFCKPWWDKIVSFPAMVEEGVINARDLDLLAYAETAQEAWDHICAFYKTCKPNKFDAAPQNNSAAGSGSAAGSKKQKIEGHPPGPEA